MSRETPPSIRPDKANVPATAGPSGTQRVKTRTSATLLPPPENTVALNPPQTASGSSSQRIARVTYPSQPNQAPASQRSPASIRPSATTVPPRPGHHHKRDELSWLASAFWGCLALAFGASAAAVYWELAEEPIHSTTTLTSPSPADGASWATMEPMERRRHERLTQWLPVRLEADRRAGAFEPGSEGAGPVEDKVSAEAGLAVTHNVSETGALLVTAQELAVGKSVRITVPVHSQSGSTAPSEPLELAARVVRVAKNEEDPEGLWPYSVAVEFSAPSPALAAVLRELAH